MQKQNSTAKRKAQQYRFVALALLVFSPTNPRKERNEQADAELRVPNVLGQRELIIIATVFLEGDLVTLEDDACQQFDLLMGREEPPSYEEQSEAVIEHLRSLKAAELSRVLLGWVFQAMDMVDISGPDRLLEAAQQYGVDIEQIRRQVVSEKKKSAKPANRDLQTSAKHPAETGSAAATSAAV